MDSKRAWIGYIVIRVLAFLVPFVVIMVAFPGWEANWLVGLIVGTIVGLAVSYIFLRRQRMQMGEDLAELRGRKDQRMQLDREEDAVIDGTAASAARSATSSAPQNDSAPGGPARVDAGTTTTDATSAGTTRSETTASGTTDAGATSADMTQSETSSSGTADAGANEARPAEVDDGPRGSTAA